MFERDLNRFLEAYESYLGVPFDYMRAWEKLSRQYQEKADIKPESGHTYISLQGAHGGPQIMRMLASHFSVPVRDDTCSGNRKPDGTTKAGKARKRRKKTTCTGSGSSQKEEIMMRRLERKAARLCSLLLAVCLLLSLLPVTAQAAR